MGDNSNSYPSGLGNKKIGPIRPLLAQPPLTIENLPSRVRGSNLKVLPPKILSPGQCGGGNNGRNREGCCFPPPPPPRCCPPPFMPPPGCCMPPPGCYMQPPIYPPCPPQLCYPPQCPQMFCCPQPYACPYPCMPPPNCCPPPPCPPPPCCMRPRPFDLCDPCGKKPTSCCGAGGTIVCVPRGQRPGQGANTTGCTCKNGSLGQGNSKSGGMPSMDQPASYNNCNFYVTEMPKGFNPKNLLRKNQDDSCETNDETEQGTQYDSYPYDSPNAPAGDGKVVPPPVGYPGSERRPWGNDELPIGGGSSNPNGNMSKKGHETNIYVHPTPPVMSQRTTTGHDTSTRSHPFQGQAPNSALPSSFGQKYQSMYSANDRSKTNETQRSDLKSIGFRSKGPGQTSQYDETNDDYSSTRQNTVTTPSTSPYMSNQSPHNNGNFGPGANSTATSNRKNFFPPQQAEFSERGTTNGGSAGPSTQGQIYQRTTNNGGSAMPNTPGQYSQRATTGGSAGPGTQGQFSERSTTNGGTAGPNTQAQYSQKATTGGNGGPGTQGQLSQIFNGENNKPDTQGQFSERSTTNDGNAGPNPQAQFYQTATANEENDGPGAQAQYSQRAATGGSAGPDTQARFNQRAPNNVENNGPYTENQDAFNQRANVGLAGRPDTQSPFSQNPNYNGQIRASKSSPELGMSVSQTEELQYKQQLTGRNPVVIHKTTTQTQLQIIERPNQPSEIHVLQRPVNQVVGYENPEDNIGGEWNRNMNTNLGGQDGTGPYPGSTGQGGRGGNMGYNLVGENGRGIGPDGRGLGPDGRGFGPDGRGLGPDGRGFGPDGRGLGPDGRGFGPDGRGLGPDGRGFGPDGRGLGPNGRGQGGNNNNGNGGPAGVGNLCFDKNKKPFAKTNCYRGGQGKGTGKVPCVPVKVTPRAYTPLCTVPVRETIASILMKKPPANCKWHDDREPFVDYCSSKFHGPMKQKQKYVDRGVMALDQNQESGNQQRLLGQDACVGRGGRGVKRRLNQK